MKNFSDLVASRFSCRSYLPDPVPEKHILKVLEAARLAPSACNMQPWRFAVATDRGLRERLIEEGCLPGLGMKWAREAPVLLVLGVKRSLVTHKVAPLLSKVDYPLIDIGIAGEHAVLQAEELGLGTCWIGWIKPKEVRSLLEWPGDIAPQAMITVGYPASRPEKRSGRMPLEDIVTWR